jgi:hypothetical protein
MWAGAADAAHPRSFHLSAVVNTQFVELVARTLYLVTIYKCSSNMSLASSKLNWADDSQQVEDLMQG